MDGILEKVIAIARAFDRAEVPHSFGGAIALGYYGYTRGTHDIDINVYLAVDDAYSALDVLSPEDLLVCKVVFGRDKDRRDIGLMLDSVGEELEVEYVLRWAEFFLAAEDERLQGLRQALSERSLLSDC